MTRKAGTPMVESSQRLEGRFGVTAHRIIDL